MSLPEKMRRFYRGSVVLVTGGCGSIGSSIVERLLELRPSRVRIFDSNEGRLFELQQKLASKYNRMVRFLIGDVRDKQRLELASDGVDIIIHAAAYKHVPLCEYNPQEAVLTNVLGTQNVIEVALRKKVKKTLLISTDKAVNPVNTLGATKLLSEKLMMNAAMGRSKSMFSCVRFGNVLNTSGSVVQVFREQITSGGKVTVTSRNMTRFIMSGNEAAGLILKSGYLMKGREIFILKMRSLRIIDLAEGMARELAPRHGKNLKQVKIQEMGLRPGEKLHEELISESEAPYVQEVDGMYVVKSGLFTPTYVEQPPEIRLLESRFTSKDVPKLTHEQIRELLVGEGVV